MVRWMKIRMSLGRGWVDLVRMIGAADEGAMGWRESIKKEKQVRVEEWLESISEKMGWG